VIIVFLCLFAGILSGFPVAFAIGGSAVISFGIIAALDSAGLLIHQAIDPNTAEYAAVLAEGVKQETISVFRYPDLPRIDQPVFLQGWETALDRNVSFIVNRMNERVLAGASIETLLAVLMFVLMGITLERSKIANDLLTTMARVFGPLPGGLAVSVVVVGAFLAASTGIVGATVVTMGLLSLPTMLRNNYSPELATGVIAASGTLGQIIPPSIVIVLLGTLAGDLYSAAQESRAQELGCSDALTYLGEPAVVSVGTLFQAALLPGILLAVLYALYAFGYALFNPSKAPAVELGSSNSEPITKNEALTWFLFAPVGLIVGFILLLNVGIFGSQNVTVDSFSDAGQTASLRTNVSESCQEAMIDLHGIEAWETALAEQAAIDEAGGIAASVKLTEEELTQAVLDKIDDAAPVGTGIAIGLLLMALVFAIARGVSPSADKRPLIVGTLGILLAILIDILLISPVTTPGNTVLLMILPLMMIGYGLKHAAVSLGKNELLKVVFPPLVLIVAVLGSILGGITNPTPAAALGAGGAILLAAYRKLQDTGQSGRIILMATFAVVIMILVGVNFDLRVNIEVVTFENLIAFIVAKAAYLFAIFGILFGCWVLFSNGVLSPVVRETAKVTSMVFTILIGSQLLNLVVISFGGEHYIQQFLRSFDSEFQVFIIVMLVLFVLGFVLDFLEIIYIVIPIVGPVIYGGTMDPKWVTIMIAVHIYRGIIPFVLIQVLGLLLLALFPGVVTIIPNLLSG